MLLVLGGLSAVPPLSFDMYLPALPQVADSLGVPEAQIQLTLSACLLGLAFGQLFGGPVSDSLGRRRPLLWGVGGYAVAASRARSRRPHRRSSVFASCRGSSVASPWSSHVRSFATVRRAPRRRACSRC